jgi:hypothetical protein
MTEEKKKPLIKKISKDEADKNNDYAQSLDDEITHVVDYGGVNGLGEEDKEDE